MDNPFANDLQYLDAWKLRNEDGFTWFYDAWTLVPKEEE